MIESVSPVSGRRVLKISKSQVQLLHAPADEQLVDVQPQVGGMRAFVTLKMMTDEGIEGIGLTFAPALGLSPLAPRCIRRWRLCAAWWKAKTP